MGELKGFIEVTSMWYNGGEYAQGDKLSININHIFLFGNKYIKTIEDVCQAPTNVAETYEEIKELIQKATQ